MLFAPPRGTRGIKFHRARIECLVSRVGARFRFVCYFLSRVGVCDRLPIVEPCWFSGLIGGSTVGVLQSLIVHDPGSS